MTAHDRPPADAGLQNTMLTETPFLGEAPHGVRPPQVHVLPRSVYFAVLGALLFLTLVTVVTAQINLGVFNLPLAMIIAVSKASLVLAVFMHLYWDNKFNLLIFASSLLFLAIFVVLTMLDTEGRSIIEAQRRNFLPRDEAVHQARATANDPHVELRPGEALGHTEGRTNYEEAAQHGGEPAPPH